MQRERGRISGCLNRKFLCVCRALIFSQVYRWETARLKRYFTNAGNHNIFERNKTEQTKLDEEHHAGILQYMTETNKELLVTDPLQTISIRYSCVQIRVYSGLRYLKQQICHGSVWIMMFSQVTKEFKSVNPKISRIGRQKRNNEFFSYLTKRIIWLPIFGNDIKRFSFFFFSFKICKWLENSGQRPSAPAMRLEIWHMFNMLVSRMDVNAVCYISQVKKI